jgi:hypothetical protein
MDSQRLLFILLHLSAYSDWLKCKIPAAPDKQEMASLGEEAISHHCMG